MTRNQPNMQVVPVLDERIDLSKIEQTLVHGNLGALNAEERLTFYKQICDSLGLNPLTKPFDYIQLNGKLVLYATRSCTDQLRSVRKVSIEIADRTQTSDGVYMVTARATDSEGRTDEAIGAVIVANLKGEAYANAIMKCETKAKRRATLSLCGLGLLDESEVEGAVNAPCRRNTQISEAVRPQIEDTEERKTLITRLEETVKSLGLDGLAKEWKENLTTNERKSVGAAELQRIKGLSIVTEGGVE